LWLRSKLNERKEMKKTLFILILLFFGLYYVDTQTHWITNRVYEINNVSKKQKITLYKMKGQEHIYRFSVHITGHINGNAKIKFYNSSGAGLLYKYKTISRDVDIKWGGDWYTDIIEMEYNPIDVIKGNLSIEYSFDGF